MEILVPDALEIAFWMYYSSWCYSSPRTLKIFLHQDVQKAGTLILSVIFGTAHIKSHRIILVQMTRRQCHLRVRKNQSYRE